MHDQDEAQVRHKRTLRWSVAVMLSAGLLTWFCIGACLTRPPEGYPGTDTPVYRLLTRPTLATIGVAGLIMTLIGATVLYRANRSGSLR